MTNHSNLIMLCWISSQLMFTVVVVGALVSQYRINKATKRVIASQMDMNKAQNRINECDLAAHKSLEEDFDAQHLAYKELERQVNEVRSVVVTHQKLLDLALLKIKELEEKWLA